MKKFLLILPFVIFLAFGCNRSSTRPNNSQQVFPPLNIESLKNAKYNFLVKELADVYPKDSLKLTNGIYYFALPQGAARDEYLAKLDEQHVAFGDLNNDGRKDAAAILVSMAGKNRIYPMLSVLLDNNGVAEFSTGVDLGQGVQVTSVNIRDNKVEVTITQPGLSEPKTLIYRFSGNELIQE